MATLEEEKSKILLDGMPYLRQLYIKGLLAMHEILSITWKDGLAELQKKLKKMDDNQKSNTVNNEEKENELKELNNKIFVIFSFINYYYQMIDNGKKLPKYLGLYFIVTKLNGFISLCKKIINYKILDINYNEFKKVQSTLKILTHVKIFLIFCEYDLYQSQQEFLEEILLIFKPKNEDDNNNINEENEEDKVINDLYIEIKNQNIDIETINNYMKTKYENTLEEHSNLLKENDIISLICLLYDNYFEENIEQSNNDLNNLLNEKNDSSEKTTSSNEKPKNKKRKKNKNKKKQNENTLNNITINNDTKEESNENFSQKIKVIKSITQMTDNLINDNVSTSNDDEKSSNLLIPQNKHDFEEIKIKFFQPLIPYIEQYKKVYGNKKMPILSLLQCAFIVFEEKYKKEKAKLLKEIDNLKHAMNQMFIQIQLMGGGRDIFRSTLYYLILIFIPEEKNISSFFLKVQKLIKFFENKVNSDLELIKKSSNVTNNNMNQIINRLHRNSQYVLFIKSLFFMYKYFNYVVHLNTNQKLKNISQENNSNNKSIVIKKNDMIFPTFNFNDCFTSYANFLDEIVTNEKTQIILEQVLENIQKENEEGDLPKFECKDLFQEIDGKKIFNLTGFDIQIIIHDIKKMKYNEETIENLVNTKTWEKSQ